MITPGQAFTRLTFFLKGRTRMDKFTGTERVISWVAVGVAVVVLLGSPALDIPWVVPCFVFALCIIVQAILEFRHALDGTENKSDKVKQTAFRYAVLAIVFDICFAASLALFLLLPKEAGWTMWLILPMVIFAASEFLAKQTRNNLLAK